MHTWAPACIVHLFGVVQHYRTWREQGLQGNFWWFLGGRKVQFDDSHYHISTLLSQLPRKTLRHTKCLTRKAHIVVGCMCACIMSYLLSIILSLQTLCMCFEDTHGQLFRGKVAPRCKAVHGHSLKESEVKITLLDTTATSDSSHPTYNYPTPKCLGDWLPHQVLTYVLLLSQLQLSKTFIIELALNIGNDNGELPWVSIECSGWSSGWFNSTKLASNREIILWTFFSLELSGSSRFGSVEPPWA